MRYPSGWRVIPCVSRGVILALVVTACAGVQPVGVGTKPTPNVIRTQQAINERVFADMTANPRTAAPTLTHVPTATGTKSPTATRSLAPTRTPLPSPTTCIYDAAFVADLSIPDGTVIQPGEQFSKGWRLRNSGNCPWLPGFSVVCVSDPSAEPLSYPLTEAMAPRAEVDVEVPLQAPLEPGTHRSSWRMRDNLGRYFGAMFYAEIVVEGEATPPPITLPTVAPQHQRPDTWCAEMEAYMRYLSSSHQDRLKRLLERGDVDGIVRENSRYENELRYVQEIYNINCAR